MNTLGMRDSVEYLTTRETRLRHEISTQILSNQWSTESKTNRYVWNAHSQRSKDCRTAILFYYFQKPKADKARLPDNRYSRRRMAWRQSRLPPIWPTSEHTCGTVTVLPRCHPVPRQPVSQDNVIKKRVLPNNTTHTPYRLHCLKPPPTTSFPTLWVYCRSAVVVMTIVRCPPKKK